MKNNSNKYFLGAYATAPASQPWDPAVHARYFDQLKAMDNVKGLEHPFISGLHPVDDDWFLANIDPNWDFVFTSVPGVMQRIGENPEFGIASDDSDGRELALTFYDEARQAILKLNKHLQRQAVPFIQVQTSPSRLNAVSSSARALQSSFETMQGWDWDGAKLVVEHCDTYIEGQDPAKGFLTIDEEIDAITAVNKRLGSDIGIAINWGRSALETRTVQGPYDHIVKARRAGLLKGLMFSGASDADTPYGIWKDTHMPPAQAFGISSFAQGSLLTAEEISRCLQAADPQSLGFLGVKINAKPAQLSPEERAAFNHDALAILDEILR